jgi:hypothetical protein
MILAFVAVLLLLWSIHARADQTLEFEAGAAMLRGETPAVGVTIACKECGPVRTDYEFGFDLIGESNFYQYNPNVIQVRAQIVDGYKRFEAGIGFYYQNVPTEYVCQFGFNLLARYRVSSRFDLQWRHSSSGSSCYPNAGRDLLTLGYRF